MPFYRPGQVTLQQLKHLIAIYDGEISIDLDSNVSTHFTRSKITNPIKENPDLDFVPQLKLLMMQIEQHAPDSNISIQDEMLVLLHRYDGKFTKGSAEHLLYKRIATLSFYGFKTIIHTDALVSRLAPILVSKLISYSKIPAIVSVLGGLMVLRWQHSNNTSRIELTEAEKSQLELMQLKLQEFCEQKLIVRVPKIIPTHEFQASYFSHAQEPCIHFGMGLFNLLDDEERYAVLAHELGHTKTGNLSLRYENQGYMIISITNVLLEQFNIPYPQLILLIVMIASIIALNKTILHPEEHRADEFARELAGPLAHASSRRTVSTERTYLSKSWTMFPIKSNKSSAFVEAIGLDDVLSSHPSATQRM